MKHTYDVALSESAPEQNVTGMGEKLEMTFQSHDDLHEIIAKLAAKRLFEENEAKVFAVGLKMFAGVMLAHRGDPLFSELAPQFGAFMRKLKS